MNKNERKPFTFPYTPEEAAYLFRSNYKFTDPVMKIPSRAESLMRNVKQILDTNPQLAS